jgi:POT family proton-dependent oligopeptide transporter
MTTQSSVENFSPPIDTGGISGHPRGLTTLFLTEMWERFGYYGMRALLILYMTAPLLRGGLGFDTARAGSIYGLYTGAVYFMPLFGGWLADRFFGARRAVLLGGIIISCGQFSIALQTLASFYVGLCLIAAGTGLLKPNISAMVGALYSGNDERRDAGFSIFYMGINLGAFLSPFLCGYLGQQIAWQYGFAAAGVAMVIGLIQYQLGGRYLGDAGLKQNKNKSHEPLSDLQPLSPEEKRRLAVIVILAAFSILFFMGLEQAGSSLNLFADRLTQHQLFGFSFPSSWFQSVGPIFVILLSPVFAWLWMKMGKRQPSSPFKFTLGLAFVGLGFVLLAIASTKTSGGLVSPLWLILVYFIHTLGELCLSPVGLSTVTKLAPGRMVGLMMGVWFFATALGNYAAGRVGGLFQSSPGVLWRLFGMVALVTLGAAVLLALLTPFIKKLTSQGK